MNSQPSRPLRLRADLALLLVAIIWGSAFVVQRMMATQMSVYLFNGLRFLLGGIALLPFTLGRKSMPALRANTPLLGIVLAGALLFGGGTLQQFGMKFTTAGNAGFITGLYVVLVPLILALTGGKRPQPSSWIASLVAAAGLFLLSTGGSFRLAPGDALEMAGAVLWALHVILIGWLAQRADVLHIAVTQYFVCGLLSLGVFTVFESGIPGAKAVAWWAVIFTGIFSISLGYTLQVAGQRVAPPADAAILLSLEAVLAAAGGWVFLGEKLEPAQLLGCGLMLAAMLLAQMRVFIHSRQTE